MAERMDPDRIDAGMRAIDDAVSAGYASGTTYRFAASLVHDLAHADQEVAAIAASIARRCSVETWSQICEDVGPSSKLWDLLGYRPLRAEREYREMGLAGG